MLGSDANTESEDRILEVYSQGYSRFEIAAGEVVAYYTEGVEFQYSNISVQAASLRYNHANEVVNAEGVIGAQLDELHFSCADLHIDGANGAIEISGGVKVEHNGLGVSLSCGSLKANYPGGATQINLQDMLILVEDQVEVVTREGHRITAPGLIFAGQEMTASTTGSTVLVLATVDQPTNAAGESLDLSGLEITADSLTCKFNHENQPEKLEINHITGIADGLSLTACKLLAQLASADGAPRSHYLVQAFDLYGEVQLNENWLKCSAGKADCSIADSQLSKVDLFNSVNLVSNHGSFLTEHAQAIFTECGFEFVLPEDVIIGFDLAGHSGQDPVSIDLLGDPGDE